MNQKISCLIYDMDGLLLDTEGIYTEVTQDIVGEFGKVFDWSVKKTIICLLYTSPSPRDS